MDQVLQLFKLNSALPTNSTKNHCVPKIRNRKNKLILEC